MIKAQGGVSTVLVVEDDATIRDTIEGLLTEIGYNVVTAGNGQEAIDAIHTMAHPPCVILLDLMMPVMNGWEFIAHIEREKMLRGVPIIVVSAVGKAAQFDYRKIKFLHKPVELDELLGLCEQHCPLPD